MKRLVIMLVLLTTVGATAQRHEGSKSGKKQMADLTAEQIATLHTKKLTLALDLTAKQQEKVMQISMKQAEMRKAKHAEMKAKKEGGEKIKPTADERFEMQSARLDSQIAHQQEMKEILTEDQYQTWRKLRAKKGMNGKKKMQEKGRRG